MQITFRLTGTKDIKKVYVRVYHSKLDLLVSTDLISKEKNWDAVQGVFINNKAANAKLTLLESNIEKDFNTDFGSGVIINKDWLKAIITKTFSRPNKEQKLVNRSHTIFLDDFGKYWLENDALTWRNSLSKLLTKKAIGQKKKALSQFVAFQQERKIKLIDFTSEEIKGLYHFLRDQDYSVSTSLKTLSEVKFLCKRAKELKLNVCLDFESNIEFRDDTVKYDEVYLNEDEITEIFNYDFNYSETLSIIRDNFVLSLWTGFRISDLLNLDSNALNNGLFETVTQKTNTPVKVPIHPQVKFILDKYFGHLPPKVNKDEYNIQIKEICRLCKINTPTLGKIFDQKKGRKIPGRYPKYKLVTSHTARRSFGTNLSKILPVKSVAKMGGWATEKMANHYNKETSSEIAKDLETKWNSTNNQILK